MDDSPFDIEKIRQLVQMMRKSDLSEIDLQWSGQRLRLRRGLTGHVTVAPVPPVATAPAAAPTAPSPAAATVAADFIKSPIVGTFYSSSSPDAEPYVRVGSKVNPTTVICLIEAMKVFNDIPAGMSGTIAEVLIENGSPVEYNQPLFRIVKD